MDKIAAQRKQQLLAQAGLHRLHMHQARQTIADGLQPASLIKGAGSLALAAFALSKGAAGNASGVRLAAMLPALLPLATSGMSLIRNAGALKPVVRKLLIAGVLGALVAFAVKKTLGQRRSRRR